MQTDVTAQVRAEQAVIAREAKLRGIEDGRVALLIPSGVDVTSRVHTERALEAASAHS